MKPYVLPELPYEHSALEPHYSARLLELHHGKHHAAYVAGANATLEKLAAAREQRKFEAINQLQKNLAFHVSGHVLHSLFWRNMSPPNPSGVRALMLAVLDDAITVGALQLASAHQH